MIWFWPDLCDLYSINMLIILEVCMFGWLIVGGGLYMPRGTSWAEHWATIWGPSWGKVRVGQRPENPPQSYIRKPANAQHITATKTTSIFKKSRTIFVSVQEEKHGVKIPSHNSYSNANDFGLVALSYETVCATCWILWFLWTKPRFLCTTDKTKKVPAQGV